MENRGSQQNLLICNQVLTLSCKYKIPKITIILVTKRGQCPRFVHNQQNTESICKNINKYDRIKYILQTQ